MPVRVLIVDDDRTNRLVLKAVLQKYDYEIIEAADGEEAVKIYAEQAPDIVLMDIMMPVMDGYEATRRIKSMAQGVFVPVIFLTAVTDEEALARCVDVGGDDFITKPYNHIILKAKMDAMFRIKELNDTIVSQHRELSYHHNRLNKEQEIAERIYSNIIKAGYKDVAGIKYLSSPLSLFNGDLLLFAVRPTGSLHVLVGDFTGHGLAAAIGALPVSDIFYAMTSAGFSMRDIVSSINEKLSGILPVDLFFCAAVLDIDPLAGSVSVWSGGMPDLLVVDEHNTIRTRIQSTHVPLGIIPPARFDCKLNMVNVRPGDRLYICSDGVTEMRDADGQMLGQEGLEQLFTEGVAPEQVYDHVIARLDEHRGHAEANDDLTLVEITCLAQRYDSEDTMERDFKEREPTNWSLSLSLDKASLIDFDPLPSLSRTIMEIQGLYRYKEKVYTVLAELIGNAIDHGMLGLDSSIRSTADGFARYYQERETGLRDGVDGRLDVDIRHVCDAAGGRLLVSVHDSGSGFSIAGVCNTLDDANAKSGRGIPLVKSLCQSLSYNDKGNRAEAVFKWRAQDSDDDSALDEPTQAGEGI